MTIRGSTALIAHIGWPTHTFKSPMIYNPYFEQAGIDARQKDALAAIAAGCLRGIAPQRDPTIDQAFGIGPPEVYFRIEAPLFDACFRLESDDAVERGRQVHGTVYDDWCCLEGAPAPTFAAVGNIPGVVFPGSFQSCDVRLVDLSEPRITASPLIATIIGPLSRGAVVRPCIAGA